MFFRLPNGCRIWYELLGEEQAPVVCLTHSLTADSGMWAEQVPALLQSGYRVLRMDIRGHGASDAVAGPYSLDDLADDVASVVNGLALGAIHYVGLSIGGMFGQAFAVNHPHLLWSLTLCDTLPSSAAGASDLWNERIAVAREAGSLAPLAEATLSRWFTATFRTNSPLRYQQFNESILATSLDGFEGCARAMQDFDFSSVLPSLRVPALVLCGADDPGTPPSENRRLAALIPGAHYVELDGCRHLPNVEKPSDFNSTLLGWLKTKA